MAIKQKKGEKLHHFIQQGGKPANYKGAMANAVVNRKKK